MTGMTRAHRDGLADVANIFSLKDENATYDECSEKVAIDLKSEL